MREKNTCLRTNTADNTHVMLTKQANSERNTVLCFSSLCKFNKNCVPTSAKNTGKHVTVPVPYNNYSCPCMKNVLANRLNNYCNISLFHRCRHLFNTKQFKEMQPVEHISCVLILFIPCNLTIFLVITNRLNAHTKYIVHFFLHCCTVHVPSIISLIF